MQFSVGHLSFEFIFLNKFCFRSAVFWPQSFLFIFSCSNNSYKKYCATLIIIYKIISEESHKTLSKFRCKKRINYLYLIGSLPDILSVVMNSWWSIDREDRVGERMYGNNNDIINIQRKDCFRMVGQDSKSGQKLI